MRADRSSSGLTLIELMVTLTVAGILTALAAPGFRSLINDARLVSATNELAAALNFARSEAITRGVPVTVCKSANTSDANPTCATSGGWQAGWLTFTDSNKNGTVDTGEVRLRVRQPGDATSAMTGDSNFSNYLIYLASGGSLGNGGSTSGGTLSVCAAGNKRDIQISSTGRISIAKGTC